MAATSCAPSLAALHECKNRIGLLPQQCYPPSGYKGECDDMEYALKKCRAFSANARDAAVLYNAQAPRDARVAANARLQKALKRFNKPCTP